MISRRQFVWLAGSALASTLISACQRQAPTGSSDASAPGTESTGSPSRSAVQGTRSGAYDQAPALNAADYGALPPVDERLPRQPMVLGTPADVGAYGGVLRRPILQTTYGRTEPRLRGTVLRRPGEEATKVVDALNAHRFFLYDEHLTLRPWLCESWEYDSQGFWILHLREGLRWSDGHPFTLQDLQFALDFSPRLGSGEARSLARERFEVVDDFELRVHQASLDALTNLAQYVDTFGLLVPAHYMRRLLPDSADPEELRGWALEGLGRVGITPAAPEAAWLMWWDQQVNWRVNPELPSLNPWVLAGNPEADTFTYRRNPYCWVVDTAGQQLPYLDEITFTWTETEALRNTLRRAESDIADQGLAVSDHAWLQENLDTATYDLHACPSTGHLALCLNLSAPDPAKRAFADDRGVRQAISHLIDRDGLNLFHYNGLLTPPQLAPATGGVYANDDLAGCFLAHDPIEANRLLDAADYASRDREGYRLLPSGDRLSWTMLEISPTGIATEGAQFVADCLAEGGIECRVRAVVQIDFRTLYVTNEWDALYGRVELPVVPTGTQFGFWTGSLPSAYWYGLLRPIDGEPYLKPLPEHFLWSLWTLGDQYRTATAEDERIALWQQAMEIWRQELPAIGILGEMPRLVVVRKGLRGLDPHALYADELGGLGGGRLALFHYVQ